MMIARTRRQELRRLYRQINMIGQMIAPLRAYLTESVQERGKVCDPIGLALMDSELKSLLAAACAMQARVEFLKMLEDGCFQF